MTPYELGHFVGGFVACLVLRALLEAFARSWPSGVARIAFLNLTAFLLASWLYAHGTALSEERNLVPLSTMHQYFFPQLAVFITELSAYLFRRKKEDDEAVQVSSRIEPTL
jgi:hypothetical protein